MHPFPRASHVRLTALILAGAIAGCDRSVPPEAPPGAPTANASSRSYEITDLGRVGQALYISNSGRIAGSSSFRSLTRASRTGSNRTALKRPVVTCCAYAMWRPLREKLRCAGYEAGEPLRVLREMLRVGQRAIVAFPNFGHWRVRLVHLWSGRAPQTRLFPHSWYDSPNIHFLTVYDFEALAVQEQWQVERRIFLSGRREVQMLPNLRAEVAVFLVSRAS